MTFYNITVKSQLPIVFIIHRNEINNLQLKRYERSNNIKSFSVLSKTLIEIPRTIHGYICPYFFSAFTF